MAGGEYEIFNNDDINSIEEPNSNFNQHRRDVIKYSIESNLPVAISNYNNYTSSSNNFQMPKLKETEWDKLVNHISIISFLQGLNIGGKVYNGYSIITNTKNKEVVSEDSIYILSDENSERTYHRVNENSLNDTSKRNLIRGILNIDLERRRGKVENGTAYYYPIKAFGSYLSVVSQNNVAEVDNIYKYLSDKPEIAKLYYTALGRERYTTYKNTRNSEKLKKDQYQN